jgi:outer membrane protein TolC
MAEGKQGKVQLAAGLMGVYLLLTSSGALADSVELTLADSIGLALKNNPSVTISTAMQESSLWATRQAEAGWGPLITFSNSDARAHVSSPLSRYSSQFDNHLGLLQPLYTGGLVEGLVAQAKLDAQISSLGLDKTKRNCLA